MSKKIEREQAQTLWKNDRKDRRINTRSKSFPYIFGTTIACESNVQIILSWMASRTAAAKGGKALFLPFC